MIKRMPQSLKLPNYSIRFTFVENLEENKEGIGTEEGKIGCEKKSLTLWQTSDQHKWFGVISIDKGQVEIKYSSPVFNKYLYSIFLTAFICMIHDLDLSDQKIVALGNYVYHLLHFNNLLEIRKKLESKNSKFLRCKIKVPSFDLDVALHNKKDDPIGYVIVSHRRIRIYSGVLNKLKFIILIHELIEWGQAIYKLEMPHTDINIFSEYLAYIISNNKFVT